VDLVDESELWELLGLALPAPPPVAVGGRDMPLLSPITWGDVLFALAYVVPWAAFWLFLRRPQGWAEIEPLTMPDLSFGPDRLHGAVGIRAWDGGRWAWVPACEHLGRPGWGLLAALGLRLEPPVPWPLCGREECPFGRAELFWRGLGFGPVDPNPQGASRPFYPGLVGFYVEGDPPPPWRAWEYRLKYGFILALNFLPLGRGATGGLRLLPAVASPNITVAPARSGFAAWVYTQLTGLVRSDLGEPDRRTCSGCGKEFTPTRADQLVCSRKCRDKKYYRRNRDKKIQAARRRRGEA
jgi:predicted nucleic acid-binding Zn ribbon protein